MALHDKTNQDMESSLEHAARVVQTRFSQFERNVIIPCMKSSRHFAGEYPIITTFISIFSLLSFFPVLSFLGLTVLVSTTFFFIAFAISLFLVMAFIITAGGILAILLTVIFTASIIITITAVSLFVTARLGQHVRSETNLKQGINSWAQETRSRLIWHKFHAPEPTIPGDAIKEESSMKGSDDWQAVNNGHS